MALMGISAALCKKRNKSGPMEKLRVKKYNANAIMAVAVMLTVLYFIVDFFVEPSPIFHIGMDIVIICAAAAIVKGVYGMVRELNVALTGVLVWLIGDTVQYWPQDLGGDPTLGYFIWYIFFIPAILMILYGFLNFKEKYKFD